MNRTIHDSRGFSLVEVLVAVAILAIISLPILRAFTQAATVNAKARREENADTAAGAVAEDFKSLPLEQLKQRYKPVYEDGKYIFTVTDEGGSSYTGVNGEDFAVEVVLDPSAYTDGQETEGETGKKDNPKNNINSYDMPQFTSLDDSGSIVLRNEIYQWDADAVGTFALQSGESDSKKVAAAMKRAVDITVEVRLESEDADAGTGHFVQSVYGTVTYTYGGNGYSYTRNFEKKNEFTISKDEDNTYSVSEKNGLKRVYLFYTPFDIYSNEQVTNVNDPSKNIPNVYYASHDSLDINCSYDEESIIKYEDIDIYLIQQDIKAAENSDAAMYMNRENVGVSICGSRVELSAAGTVELSAAAGTDGPVNIYSNIYGWSSYKKSGAGHNNGITVNGYSSGEGYLYTMTVRVWLDEQSRAAKEEALATVVSTKEN